MENKLDNLANLGFAVFVLLMIYIMYTSYYREPPASPDLDGDGIVTKKELQAYIAAELERKSKSPPQFRGLIKSAISGAVRGGLMGLLLSNTLEGAAVSAIVLGVINPVVGSVENAY